MPNTTSSRISGMIDQASSSLVLWVLVISSLCPGRLRYLTMKYRVAPQMPTKKMMHSHRTTKYVKSDPAATVEDCGGNQNDPPDCASGKPASLPKPKSAIIRSLPLELALRGVSAIRGTTSSPRTKTGTTVSPRQIGRASC